MDENKRNPLHYAAHKNNLKAITALLEESKKQGKNIVFVLFVHIRNLLFILFDFCCLVKKKVNKSQPKTKDKNYFYSRFLFLLGKLAEYVNTGDEATITPLIIASACGYADAVSLLLQYGNSSLSRYLLTYQRR